MVICNRIEINFQNFVYNINKNNSIYNVPYNNFLHKNLFDYKIEPTQKREISINTYYPAEFNYFNSEKKHLEHIDEYLNTQKHKSQERFENIKCYTQIGLQLLTSALIGEIQSA